MNSSLNCYNFIKLKPSIADKGGGMSACCTAGELFDIGGNGWPYNALRYR